MALMPMTRRRSGASASCDAPAAGGALAAVGTMSIAFHLSRLSTLYRMRPCSLIAALACAWGARSGF